MDYAPWQIERIRQGVRAFQQLGAPGGANYTWPEVEAAIEEETGKNVPHSRLNKFIVGEPHKDKAKKERGIRHYPILDQERLASVVEFLTNPRSGGFMFMKRDLDLYAPLTHGPLALMEYLNGKSNRSEYIKAPEFISPEVLSGLFVSSNAQNLDRLSVSLRFSEATFENLVNVVLVQFSGTDLRLPEMLRQEELQLRKSTVVLFRYFGFAIMTPEDNLLIVTKREKARKNLIFSSIGLDGSIYQDPAVLNAMVLIKHDTPVDYVDIQSDADEKKLNDAVSNELPALVYLFSRVAQSNEVQCGDEGV